MASCIEVVEDFKSLALVQVTGCGFGDVRVCMMVGLGEYLSWDQFCFSGFLLYIG